MGVSVDGCLIRLKASSEGVARGRLGWDHGLMLLSVAASVLPLAQWGHHDGDDWWMWTVMGIGIVLFWTLVVLGIIWLVRELTGRHHRGAQRAESDDALAILDRRLAEGAISAEEYRERREILKEGRST
jgi:putative membrane protein